MDDAVSSNRFHRSNLFHCASLFPFVSVGLRLPDGFTQLRGLAHLSLNDVSLQSLPNDIGK